MTAAAQATWMVANNGVAHVVSGSLSRCGTLGSWAQWRTLAPGQVVAKRCARCDGYDAPDTVGYDEMCRAGPTYRQVDHWTRTGHLRTLPRPRGSGGPVRRFPASEVPVAAMMARLTAAGVLLDVAERVARGGELAPGLRVVADGGEAS